jgi:hypothetical protein
LNTAAAKETKWRSSFKLVYLFSVPFSAQVHQGRNVTILKSTCRSLVVTRRIWEWIFLAAGTSFVYLAYL